MQRTIILAITLLVLSACHSILEKTSIATVISPSPTLQPTPYTTPHATAIPKIDTNTQSSSLTIISESSTSTDNNRQTTRRPASSYQTNHACVDLIKSFEGVRYEAYRGPAGHWLIGYGHKQGVTQGMKITAQQAEDYLKQDLQSIEQQVGKMVKTNITENEFSALVCLAYNIGWGNLLKSTVMRQVNTKNWQQAADAFLMWRKANGKVNSHLEKRRALERQIFLIQ